MKSAGDIDMKLLETLCMNKKSQITEIVLKFCVLISAILLVNGCGIANKTPSIPHIELEKTIYDFGEIDEKSDSWIVEVPVFNAGSESLELLFHNSTCGCIEVMSYDKETLPGEVGFINIKVDPALGHSGHNEEIVTFKTNATNLPLFSITLVYSKGNIDILYSPRAIEFRITKEELLKKGQVNIGQIYIKDRWAEKLLIEKTEFSNPNFGYSSFDTIYTCPAGRQSHNIKFTFFVNSKIPVGIVNEKISLFTNHEKYPQIDIPVKGLIEPRVKITPKTIFLKNLVPQQIMKRTILVKSTTDSLKLGKVQIDHPWLKLTDVDVKDTQAIIFLEGKVPQKINASNEIIMKNEIKIEIEEPDPSVESVEVLTCIKG